MFCMLARDVFSIPVSTVSAESAFSMTDNILNPHRSRLMRKMVEILTTVKDWKLAEIRCRTLSKKRTLTSLDGLRSGRFSDVALPPPSKCPPHIIEIGFGMNFFIY